MSRIRVDYEVTLTSPLHIGTGEGFAGIIDKKTLSYQEDSKRFPIIYGHSVKGIIRDEFQKLLSITKNGNVYFHELFGSEENQGKLFFSHWVLSEDLKRVLKDKSQMLFEVKSGNQIVRGRRVAKSEHLFTHELLQNQLIFEGNISGEVEGNATLHDLPESLYYLLFTLYSVKRIGGRRRSGLGAITIKVTNVNVDGKDFTDEEVKQKLNQTIDRLVKEVAHNG